MDAPKFANLSHREQQLVELAAAGHTDVYIAHQLEISESTVNTYWGRIRSKLGASSRPELIAIYVREELGLVVSELRDKNRALTEELKHEPETFYRDLMMQAADAIILVSTSLQVEVANDEALGLFGYERNEVEGHPLAKLVPERFRDPHRDHVHHYLKDPQRQKMAEHATALALHATGREFPIAASLSPVMSADGLRVMCIVREVPVP